MLNFDTIMMFMFGLRFYVPFNSYGDVEVASSPNYTFSLGKHSLTKPTTHIFPYN